MRIHVQGKTEASDKEKLEALWKVVAEGKTAEEAGITTLKNKGKK